MEIHMVIDKGDVLEVWPRIMPLIEKGLKVRKDGIEAKHVLDMLLKGSGQLWLIVERNEIVTACVTNIYERFGRKICHYEVIGGTYIDRWFRELSARVENFAQFNNCYSVQGGGRFGWKRYLPKIGMKVCSIMYEKVLEEK